MLVVGPYANLYLTFFGDRVALTPFASVFYWRMAHGTWYYAVFPPVLYIMPEHERNAMQ
jgi:hypothetical protein